jgi:hypothetical protein
MKKVILMVFITSMIFLVSCGSSRKSAWEASNGPIPVGLCVCHKCDVRACINPDHLFLGTHADNARDRASKGRSPDRHGERHPMAKLTRADVLDIVARLDAGEGCVSIGSAFGISHSTISSIKSGTHWSSVTGRSRSVAA